jgi:hypothetical protein
MRRCVLASCLLFANLAAGCGGGSPSPGLDSLPGTGPHGGVTIRLPNDRGFVEYEVEALQKATGKRKRTSGAAVIVVYFLGPDGQSALGPGPTDVSLELKTPERSTRTIKMTRQAQPGGPAEASRYESEPGSYGSEPLRGRLTATLEGQAVSAPIVTR